MKKPLPMKTHLDWPTKPLEDYSAELKRKNEHETPTSTKKTSQTYLPRWKNYFP